MKTPRLVPLLTLFALTLATPAFAALFQVGLGTTAPPAALGGYYMQGFPDDTSPEGTATFGLMPPAAAPVSGPLLFDFAMIHYEVPSGWGTWSHGYEGDVYQFDQLVAEDIGFGPTLTMALPTDTRAFSFYLEPAFFGLNQDGSARFQVSATTANGETALSEADIMAFGGATGYGFYTDDLADSIASITILGLDTWPDGWAVGEFAINSVEGVPDGGVTVLLLGLALAGLGAVRRQVK